MSIIKRDAVEGVDYNKCDTCGGSGYLPTEFSQDCDICKGTGCEECGDECQDCDGLGIIYEEYPDGLDTLSEDW